MAEEKKQCGLMAMYRYTWPGKEETYCCAFHAVELTLVAINLGFGLQLIPMTMDEMSEGKGCTNEIPLPGLESPDNYELDPEEKVDKSNNV